MNFSYKIYVFLYIITISFSLNCAAFPDPITTKERKLYTNGNEKVRILFTGFYRYEQEKQVIKETLVKEGFVEDSNSSLELEVILQKKEPTYKYLFLHRINFVLTFLSGGLVPSHIRTEQTLTFRYSKLGYIERETEYNIGMDQWRGIPVVIFMITHWPNRIYKEQLIDATKLEIKEI